MQKRDGYCGDFTAADIGKTITVCGWAAKVRDKGRLVFIDLRDRSGLLQLAFDDATPEDLRKKAQSVRSEYVLSATGVLRRRESVNPDLPTGEIEVYVTSLDILNTAQTPPFSLSDKAKVGEEMRLRYRYLDLRREEMQQALMLRHKIVKCARDYFDSQGFLEIETPMLIRSTPEGARDYLVPSRVKPGSFFALPQSPQLYKQLLMLAGYDRYMQIARCFRDEDLRADRQPEFTQIDLEMSFADEDDVMTVNEGFVQKVMGQVAGVEVQLPLRRMPYQEAMERFGSDKPDTRFGLELRDLSGVLANCAFQVFAGALAQGGAVKGINVSGSAPVLTRKEIDKLAELAKTYGAKGLAYTRWTAESQTSSYEKFLTEEEKNALRTALDAKEGDVLLIVADSKLSVVYAALGALRVHLGKRLELIPPNAFDFLWVTDFPMFAYDEEARRYAAVHHPFTHPALADVDKLATDPGVCKARAYDLVLNGTELGGGSVRINRQDLQQQVFTALGFSQEEAQARFGFLLDAFQYGAPPHAGMAYGLDRLVMLILGKESIRDVIAFPKVQNSSELMTGCPAPVDAVSLEELSIVCTLPEGESQP